MKIFDGKRFFVYGDGLSGRAAARAVKKHGGRAKIFSDEDGNFCPPPRTDYDCAVISPGIRPAHAVYEFCREHNIRTVGEAEIGCTVAKSNSLPLVGVTGTNGKTTVTRLIADMLGGVACGNIGYPVSTAACKGVGPLVCELSSFQLHDAHITPDVAVITTTASDHIDWHGTAADYFASKCNIANSMTGGFLVLGEDVKLGALSALKTDARIVYCSTEKPCDGAFVMDGSFYFADEKVCAVDYLRLHGAHNVKNALCAIAAAKCMDADNKAIINALSGAQPSPHRTEPAGEACGKKWIDDSKGTNVSASLAAVDTTEGSVCLILGGRGKDTDFDELFSALPKRVTEVVAMGETAQSVRDSARSVLPTLKVTVVSTLADAVKAAARSSADTVLLSPACASFDEFKNYGERGDFFKRYVAALNKKTDI